MQLQGEEHNQVACMKFASNRTIKPHIQSQNFEKYKKRGILWNDNF